MADLPPAFAQWAHLCQLDPMLTAGSCTPTGGEPKGEVVVGEYLTLCCAG